MSNGMTEAEWSVCTDPWMMLHYLFCNSNDPLSDVGAARDSLVQITENWLGGVLAVPRAGQHVQDSMSGSRGRTAGHAVRPGPARLRSRLLRQCCPTTPHPAVARCSSYRLAGTYRERMIAIAVAAWELFRALSVSGVATLLEGCPAGCAWRCFASTRGPRGRRPSGKGGVQARSYGSPAGQAEEVDLTYPKRWFGDAKNPPQFADARALSALASSTTPSLLRINRWSR